MLGEETGYLFTTGKTHLTPNFYRKCLYCILELMCLLGVPVRVCMQCHACVKNETRHYKMSLCFFGSEAMYSSYVFCQCGHYLQLEHPDQYMEHYSLDPFQIW